MGWDGNLCKHLFLAPLCGANNPHPISTQKWGLKQNVLVEDPFKVIGWTVCLGLIWASQCVFVFDSVFDAVFDN